MSTATYAPTASPRGRVDQTEGTWVPVCRLDRIVPDTGVAAVVAGIQIAVFRLRDGQVHAIDNLDPCSGANVLSRGIVGDVGGRVFVASPIHKQRFDLRTGACLDLEKARVTCHPVRVVDGTVEVAGA
jgi:nitrite reductase (NADH) small subunit